SAGCAVIEGSVFGWPSVAARRLCPDWRMARSAASHAVVMQIEGSSYRLRQDADLMPEHVQSKAVLNSVAATGSLNFTPFGKAAVFEDPNLIGEGVHFDDSLPGRVGDEASRFATGTRRVATTPIVLSVRAVIAFTQQRLPAFSDVQSQ